MKIRIREQSGTSAIRRFDFQLAVALSYLLERICDKNIIVVLEALEDFAIIKGFDSSEQTVDIYQVKTKSAGNYTKSLLKDDDVIGKIFLTDYFFDSSSNSLNILCNQNINLFDKTLEFDNFKFVDKLEEDELEELNVNALAYLQNNSDYSESNVERYMGKLVYIKTTIPFQSSETPYEDMLVGLTARAISTYLGDSSNTISANAVYQACKLLIEQRTKYELKPGVEYALEDLVKQKGVDIKEIHSIINDAAKRNELDKKDYFEKASLYFSPQDFLSIKDYYPEFLAKKDDLEDPLFKDAYAKMKEMCIEKAKISSGYQALVDNICNEGYLALKDFEKPFIQLLSILVVFGG